MLLAVRMKMVKFIKLQQTVYLVQAGMEQVLIMAMISLLRRKPRQSIRSMRNKSEDLEQITQTFMN